MARYIKHTELPLDEAWPVQVRARNWEQKDGRYGEEWSIRAGLPRCNPMHSRGEYEIEYCYFTTKDEKLVKAVLACLIDAPSKTDRDTTVYELSIVREKDGKRNVWTVLPGFQGAIPARRSDSTNGGGPPAPAAPPRPSTNPTELRHQFVMLYRTLCSDLGVRELEENGVDARVLKAAIVNAASRLIVAWQLGDRP